MLKKAPMAVPPSWSGAERLTMRKASPAQPASMPRTPDRMPRMMRMEKEGAELEARPEYRRRYFAGTEASRE
jgi:hypothetical protein